MTISTYRITNFAQCMHVATCIELPPVHLGSA